MKYLALSFVSILIILVIFFKNSSNHHQKANQGQPTPVQSQKPVEKPSDNKTLAGPLQGHVFSNSDPGKSVPGVHVSLFWSRHPDSPPEQHVTKETNSEGFFIFNHIPAGYVTCLAFNEKAASFHSLQDLKAVEYDPRIGLEKDLVLQELPLCRFEVKEYGTGVWVSDAKLQLTCENRLLFERSVNSTEKGRFDAYLSADTYRLDVKTPGYLPGSLKFEPKNGLVLPIHLKPEKTLLCQVVDPTNSPISGVHIQIEEPWNIWGKTGEEGKLLLSGIPARKGFGLRLSKKGFYTREDHVPLERINSDEPFRIVLSPLKEEPFQQIVISGLVTDKDKNPIKSAAVKLFRGRELTQTDIEGRFEFVFEFQPSRSKRAYFEVVKEGYLEEGFNVYFARSKSDHNVVLHRGVPLHGRVSNEEGNPLEGVTVTFHRTQESVQTDKSGKFQLTMVVEGGSLQFEKEDYYPLQHSVQFDDTMEVELQKEIRIFGTVTVGPDKEPAQSFRYCQTGNSTEDPIWTLVQNDTGEFSCVHEQNKALVVEVEGYPPKTLFEPPEEPQNGQHLDLHFEENGILLEGTVVDSNTKPIPHVQLTVLDTGQARSIHYSAARGIDDYPQGIEGVSDQDGHFSLRGFPSETNQSLLAEHVEFCFSTLNNLNQKTEIEQRHLAVSLVRPGQINGVVNRKVFPEATLISLTNEGNVRNSQHRTQTIEDSPQATYSFVDIPPAIYRLKLFSSGNDFLDQDVFASKVVKVDEGEEVRVDFLEKEGLALSGTITFNDVPISGTTVGLLLAENQQYSIGPTQNVKCDDSGSFFFENLPPGDYLLKIFPGQFEDIWSLEMISSCFVQPVILGDEDLQVNLAYVCGSIQGTLTKPLKEETRLALQSPVISGPMPFLFATPSTDGSFVFPYLVRGSFNLLKLGGGQGSAILRTDIQLNPTTMDIDLGPIDPYPGGSIRFQTDHTSKKKDLLGLALSFNGGPFSFSTYLRLGSMEVKDLQEGHYRGRLFAIGATNFLPDVFEADIKSGQTIDLTLDAVPTTCLMLQSVHKALIKTVQVQSGEFQTAAQAIDNSDLYQMMMLGEMQDLLAGPNSVLIRNLSPGPLQVSIEFDNGDTFERTFVLVLGQTLDFTVD